MSKVLELIKVIGVGNIFCGDDGLGIYAVERLAQEAMPATVKLLLGETDPWSCLEEALEADCVLIIDALQTGGRPGSIYLVELTRLNPRSIEAQHQLNLVQLLRLYQQKGHEINAWVMGMEPANLNLGSGLSPGLMERMEEFIWQLKQLMKKPPRASDIPKGYA